MSEHQEQVREIRHYRRRKRPTEGSAGPKGSRMASLRLDGPDFEFILRLAEVRDTTLTALLRGFVRDQIAVSIDLDDDAAGVAKEMNRT